MNWVRKAVLGVLCCLGCVATTLAASQLHLQVTPLYIGDIPGMGVVPLEVSVQNNGADARGIVRVSTETITLAYPIELPQGANKKFTVYPAVQYGLAAVDLETDRGTASQSIPMPGGTGDDLYVLLIGDTPGELSFIKTPTRSNASGYSSPDQTNRELGIHDCYIRPESSPGRSSGYFSFSTIILGQGSERLGDEAVEALKTWVASGKTLIFLGGASAPILSDVRWKDLLPAKNFHVDNLKRCEYLSNLAGIDCPQMTITNGVPVASATSRMQGNSLVTASNPFGLGTITYYSFNPLDAPLNRWDGRKDALSKLMRASQNLTALRYIDGYTNIYGAVPGFGSSTTPPIPAGMAPMETDPFDSKLPPTEQVFGVLLAYFVVVIPVNFLLLRKFKKGELAWFTAPVISLVFAGVLFQSAASLYKAKLSTVTSGLIIGQSGSPFGQFIGETKMFIPLSGSYDLKLKDVTSIGVTPSYYGYRNSADNAFQIVDTGDVGIPSYAVDNLSFRDLEYRQRVPVGQWFDIHLTPTGPNTAECEVRNRGTVTLKDANLVYGVQEKVIGELKPGEHKTIPVKFSQASVKDDSYRDVKVFTQRKKRVALEGTLVDFRPGPQVGLEIAKRTSIHLCLFANLEDR